MKIELIQLKVQCLKSVEIIDFSPRVTFFHGETGSGKSSIARMIDFCLGGDLEHTPAVRKEVNIIALTARLGESTCVFERNIKGANKIHVSWTDTIGKEQHVLAPTSPPTSAPIVSDNVFNISDLIFYLCGVTPIKVKRSKSDQDSPMIRLSFRDVMWYCYLDQNKLDSSFYRLKEAHVDPKSRDVMRFVVGYHTDRLQILEIREEKLLAERSAKIEACSQMRHFLSQLGYNNDEQIQLEINQARLELEEAKQQQQRVQESFSVETHFADQLRESLRILSEKLGQEKQILSELQLKLEDEQSLKAELLTVRFKLARKESATSVLEGVVFVACPMCGTEISPENATEPDQCILCKSTPVSRKESENPPNTEVAKRDIESRISELNEALDRSRRASKRQEKRVTHMVQKKSELDARLVEELREYDSAFVAAIREYDRQVATLVERLKSLRRMKELPDTIERLLKEANQSLTELDGIRRDIEKEREGLTSANEIVGEIENAYLEALLAVGVPGVTPKDTIHISRTNWVPTILEEGEQESAWSFFDTGSGGKKTLLNVCYALAVHRVAAIRSLPLPSFLMIDTPMKNISEDVNQDLFESFYHYLYQLAQGDLSETQIIIIDKDYIEPPNRIETKERFMTPDDSKNPPLISYYRGP